MDVYQRESQGVCAVVPDAADSNNRQLIEALFESVSRGDSHRLRAISDEEVAIHSARGVLVGHDAAADWVSKRFDHLDRRYRLLDLESTGDGVMATAALEYVWRESGEVADSTEVEIEIGIRDGRITSWRLIEE